MSLKFKQLLSLEYERKGRMLNSSLFGLSSDGKVYRWDGKCSGWIPYKMEIAACSHEHKESIDYKEPPKINRPIRVVPYKFEN